MYVIIEKSRAITAFLLLLLPSFLSNATTSEVPKSVIEYNQKYFNADEFDEEDIEILSSVPKGLPVSKENIRCSLPNCSGFGYRMHPILNRRKLHAGLDLPAKRGTIIKSTHYGRVRKIVEGHPGYGNLVIIECEGYATKYAHCDSILVTEGQRVKLGQSIATVGSTGLSTAPHCHYEIEKNGVNVNPFKYIN